MIIADTPDKINMFRLLSLKGALKLEMVGMKRQGRSAYAIIKDEFGFKGNREKVLNQLQEHIERKANNDES